MVAFQVFPQYKHVTPVARDQMRKRKGCSINQKFIEIGHNRWPVIIFIQNPYSKVFEVFYIVQCLALGQELCLRSVLHHFQDKYVPLLLFSSISYQCVLMVAFQVFPQYKHVTPVAERLDSFYLLQDDDVVSDMEVDGMWPEFGSVCCSPSSSLDWACNLSGHTGEINLVCFWCGI